jgi:eukaryotic-like serine/threonine-protein kinase
LKTFPVSYQLRSYSSKEEDMAEDTFLGGLQQQSPGMLAPQDVTQFIQQAAAALQHIHDQHIVHGHLTSASFLVLLGSEQSRLLNLQLANFSAQEAIQAPASMAPEQWYGTTLPASDQYALAIMAYQLLTKYSRWADAKLAIRLHLM